MKKKRTYRLILLLIFGVTAIVVGGTYAKYTATISKSGQAVVAKWNFASDNEDTTFDINLKDNYDESTLVSSRLVDGTTYKVIAPGTEGSFDISLLNTSEVGAYFHILVGNTNNIPENIKFYKDANYEEEIIPNETSISGVLKANDSEGLMATIYWKWDYESGNSGDVSDTNAGISGDLLTLPVTINASQTEPGLNTITSHIN